jgi:hypothetical protein
MGSWGWYAYTYTCTCTYTLRHAQTHNKYTHIHTQVPGAFVYHLKGFSLGRNGATVKRKSFAVNETNQVTFTFSCRSCTVCYLLWALCCLLSIFCLLGIVSEVLYKMVGMDIIFGTGVSG